METDTMLSSERLNAQNAVEERKTFCERLNYIRKNITVEPVAFLIIFSSILSSVPMQSMALQKVCRVNLNLGDEICDALKSQNQSMGNFSEYERMVQEYISRQLVWRSALQTLFPCIMLLFVGGWSDATGRRKAIMVACLVGETLQSLNNIINVVFFDQIGVEIYLFFDVFFVGIVGGTSVMFLALFNFMCDITDEENRTYRLGFVNMCTFSAMPLGLALSGIILKNFGFYAIYGISCALHVINLVYVIFVLSDMGRTEEHKKHDGRDLWHFLKTFFNPATIKDTLEIVWKKTENNRRVQLFILLFAVTFLYGPVNGEGAIMFMFTRYRFNWDEVAYSLFQTYGFIISMIGTLISLLVFSKYLKWHDSLLGITSTVSKILSSPLYCFASSTAVFYIAPLANILSGSMISLLAVRTLYSKLLEPQEIGKMTSLIGLLENFTPLAYVPAYSKIYTNTMDTIPGAVFLFGAAVTIPALISFIWLFCIHRKEIRSKKKLNPEQVFVS